MIHSLATSKRIKTASTLLIALLFLPYLAAAVPIECQCVLYLRERLNVPIRGDAWTHIPNVETRFARAGDAILFDYGGVGKDHVALITGFQEPTEGDIYVELIEANFHRCKVSTRTISIYDPTIKGVLRLSHKHKIWS